MDSKKLLNILETGSEKSLLMALLGIEERGRKDAALALTLTSLFEHQSFGIRGLAARAYLSIIGKEGVSRVVPMLSDSNPTARANVAMAIANNGGKGIAYPVFRAMLKSDDSEMRKAAEYLVDSLDADFSADSLCEDELCLNQVERHRSQFTENESVTFHLKSGHEIDLRSFTCDDPELDSLRVFAMEAIRGLDGQFFDRVAHVLMELNGDSGAPGREDNEKVISPRAATVPPHETGPDLYFVIEGDLDDDIEHGFACLVKNMVEFCFVPRDFTTQISAKSLISQVANYYDANEKFAL